MIDQISRAPVKGYGPGGLLAWATFTQNGASNAAQTLTEGFGIASVTKTGTGLWTILLQDVHPNFVIDIDVIAPAAEFHRCQVITKVPATRTVTFGHITAATYGAIASAALGDGASKEFMIKVYARGSL